MPDCVFCRIVAGEESAERIHETESALAFLDAAPATMGHTLVVPKAHRRTITDTEPTLVADVFRLVRETVGAVETGLDVDGVNVVQSNGAAAGQEVDHLHVHVVPRRSGDEVALSWQPGDEAAPEAADRLREQF